MPCVADVDLEWLRKVTVFSVLTLEQLGTLAEAAEVTEHAEGDYLTEEGIHGHRFHLLLEGGAVVERGGTEIARIGPGDFVGEIGLLGGGTSTASVRCTSPTRCLTLRREAFWQALEKEPSIALRILEVVCRRLEREFRPGPQANLTESTGG
jgi:CRP/FNR family cyclic AMP-dependent transcriptional regulator